MSYLDQARVTGRVFLAGVAVAAALAGRTPVSAGTKVSGTLAPVPADCNTGYGFCKNGLAQASDCGTDNSLCSGGTIARSKMSLNSKLILNVSVKNLVDNDGNLVTTSVADPTDDHILKVTLDRCIVDDGIGTNCGHTIDVYVKVDLTNGKGNATADLSQALAGDPSLTGIGIVSASLRAFAASTSCVGGNSPADIAARVDQAACDSGMSYAVFGIVKP